MQNLTVSILISPILGIMDDFPGMSIDVNRKEVYIDGQLINLTAKEFDILQLRVENPNRIFNAEIGRAHV